MIATLATSQKWVHCKIEEKKNIESQEAHHPRISSSPPPKQKTQRKKEKKRKNTHPVHQVLTKLLCAAHHPRAPVGLLMRFFFSISYSVKLRNCQLLQAHMIYNNLKLWH
jgi:hypothetical protein